MGVGVLVVVANPGKSASSANSWGTCSLCIPVVLPWSWSWCPAVWVMSIGSVMGILQIANS